MSKMTYQDLLDLGFPELPYPMIYRIRKHEDGYVVGILASKALPGYEKVLAYHVITVLNTYTLKFLAEDLQVDLKRLEREDRILGDYP
jgi:hypothetical protein